MTDLQLGLFTPDTLGSAPLAHRVRPLELEHFFGQKSVLKRVKNLDFNKLPHLVFYGPPGCGKTTLAHILADRAELKLYPFNAVLGGVVDLRKIIKEALDQQEISGEKSIIFIDEIHRFNKGQQDALLPYLEKGDFVLFGATTENPNTSLNKAVLSRVQRWKLDALSSHDIEQLL
ncbi:MAG: AAA family ATPase, partial [Flavobacteriaceae bacterium]|nr:AAA family ATPase [Flavobacteriaceae bacterium]